MLGTRVCPVQMFLCGFVAARSLPSRTVRLLTVCMYMYGIVPL